MLKKAIKNDKNADRHYEDACNLPYESKIQWTKRRSKTYRREKKIIETIDQIQKKNTSTQ